MILLTVWGDPIVWKRPGLNKKTGAVYDQQAKEKNQYRCQISSKAPEKLFTGPLEVEVIFYMPIPKSVSKIKTKEMLVGKLHHIVKPDVDNLQKFILDCMTGIIYKDDAQIIKITATKVYSATTRTAICVRPVLREQPIYIGGEYACD